MANWSSFSVHFHGDDLVLSRLFQHWRETAARNEPGAELTVLANPFASDSKRIPGPIHDVVFDETRFSLRGIGRFAQPIDWLRSLTASAPIACTLDYRNPDDNVDHLVLIANNEIHRLYSVENELSDHVELQATSLELVVRLPRPPESRAQRTFEDDRED